jgi:L,D-transpeptidase YcbB
MSVVKYLFLFFLFLGIVSCGQYPEKEDVQKELQGMSGNFNRDSLHQKVYSHINFEPIWVKAQGLNRNGEELLAYLDEVKYEGLDEKNYLLDEIESLVSQVRETTDPEMHAILDMMLSNSYWRLAKDLDKGRVDPASLNFDWKIEASAKKSDYYQMLIDLHKNKVSVAESLDELKPKNFRYVQLKDMLKKALEKEERDRQVIAFADKIEPGEDHEVIPLIRRRLAEWGDFTAGGSHESQTYDEDLQEAVKRFQSRHGLSSDGVLGEDFLEAVNYQHTDYITKIKVNLERLRWLPDFVEGDNKKVVVNIPDFNLFYLNGEDTVFTSRVVVGKEYRQTPVFSSKMSYLVFSPTWTLPQTILWEDVIPSIQKDEGYLERNKMQVIANDGEPIDPKDVEWDKLTKDEFPYVIRQVPGDHNSLGRVKFMFPNNYSVYIHDSPAKSLFDKDERTYSSGCIRIEKPVEFASLLLQDSGWDEDRILDAMQLEDEKNVNLQINPEVWILYLTVWENQKGVQVREDIYDGDRKLAEALSLPVSDYFH